MKVLILFNNKAREFNYLNLIKKNLVKKGLKAEIINGSDSKLFFTTLFNFKPNVILTFPITGREHPYKLHFAKLFFKSKIICLRTEGAMDESSSANIIEHAGIAKYSKFLVDLELFWGKKQRGILGAVIESQGKITSIEKCKVVGYPRIEFDLKLHKKSNKNHIGIFTNFQDADFRSKSDLISAKDISNSVFDTMLEIANKSFQFRSMFINSLSRIAKQNPSLNFILKTHPAENIKTYEELNIYSNIKILDGSENLGLIFSDLCVIYHFGSTVLLDSFVYKIPSVQIYSDLLKNINSYGWQSTKTITLDEFDETIKNPPKFQDDLYVKSILEKEINYFSKDSYSPVNNITDIIVDNNYVSSKISIINFYSLKTLFALTYFSFRFFKNKIFK